MPSAVAPAMAALLPIRLAVTLPQRAVLQEIVVAPTRQRDMCAGE